MNVTEELVEFEDQLDRTHVERRLEDWHRRIDNLYADVVRWLPSDWEERRSAEIVLIEELIRKFNVIAPSLPVLELFRDGIRQGKLEPRALWIIGANGRLDLILPASHFLIVDYADNFETPQWQISNIIDRMAQRPLDRDAFRASLA